MSYVLADLRAGHLVFTSKCVNQHFRHGGAIGIIKVWATAGGFEIFLDESILAYVAHRSAEPGPFHFNFGLLVLENPFMSKFLEVGFFVLTVFEALSMIALFNRWFRWCWIVVMLSFHVSTILFMQISFSANMVLIVMLLTPATPYAAARIRMLLDHRTGPGASHA